MRKLIALCALIPYVANAGMGFLSGSTAGANNPLNLPTVTSSNFSLTFLGSWKAPTAFAYYGSAMAVSGSDLYMTGDVSGTGCGGEGIMTIPTLSGTPAYDGSNAPAPGTTGGSTTVVAPTIVESAGSPSLDWGNGTTCGGTENIFTGALVYSGSLYLTGTYSFDSNDKSTKWIVPISDPTGLSNASWGVPSAPSTSQGTGARYFAGVLGTVPSEWQPYVGGPAYVASGEGGIKVSIIGSLPAGFTFSTFDPAAVPQTGGSVSLTELLNYPNQGNFYVSRTTNTMLANRVRTGPFGSGMSYTVTSIGAGATSAPFASQSGVSAVSITTQPTGTLTNGTYTNVSLSDDSSSGTGATATVTVKSGALSDVSITNFGSSYAVNDTLFIPSASIPGATANGVVTVSAVTGSTFTYPYPADGNTSPPAVYQATFSDGETRDVYLQYGVSTSLSWTGGLTCSPSCSTSVTLKPYGDAYVSEYDGPLAYAFFYPGSSSFVYIESHSYGPLSTRVNSSGGTPGPSPCDPNGQASGNNDSPYYPDTNAYRELEVFAYNVQDLVSVKDGSQAIYTANPSGHWSFPNSTSLLVSGNSGQAQGCYSLAKPGAFFFDPSTDILYGTIDDSYGGGNGNNIIYEWKVNSLQ